MTGLRGRRARISVWSSGVSSSSASRQRIQVPVHFSMAEFFCAAKPFHGSRESLALKEAAISRVRSVEPESTTMISSANWTLVRVRARLASSLSVMMATESVGDMGWTPFPRAWGRRTISCFRLSYLPKVIFAMDCWKWLRLRMMQNFVRIFQRLVRLETEVLWASKVLLS